MASASQLPLLFRLPLSPARRVIAMDPGSHAVKFLLVEELFGRVRVLRHHQIALQEEGLLSAEELQRHLQEVLHDFGPHPVALVLPQHRSSSQIVDLPAAVGPEVRRLMEEQTVKLSGLSESAVTYDYAPLSPFGKYQKPFWLTLCQETDAMEQVRRLGLAKEDVCEITTTANALATAFRALHPGTERQVLVDLGATQTVVAVLSGGQAVFASSFPLGTDAFVEEKAEPVSVSKDLLPGSEGVLTAKLQAWLRELRRVVNESLAEHQESPALLEAAPVFLSGGGALRPGLIEQLNHDGSLRFQPWPVANTGEGGLPSARFAVAYGAALRALGRSPQAASLLPVELRQIWKKHRSLERLHLAGALLVVLAALSLAFGTWQKLRLLNRKERMLAESQGALEKARSTVSLNGLLVQQYETLRPVLQHQRETWDTLRTLAALQQARSNRNFWYLLFADQQSYFTARAPGQTNPPPPLSTSVSNGMAHKHGFVAELCVPEEPEAMRRTLSQLVAELKKSPLFRNVDALPADRRRNLVDARLVLPDRTSSLELELAETDFRAPEKLPERRTSVPLGPELRPAPRSPGRPDRHGTSSTPSKISGFLPAQRRDGTITDQAAQADRFSRETQTQ